MRGMRSRWALAEVVLSLVAAVWTDAAMAADATAEVDVFSAYVWQLTGDPLQWVHWQALWGRSLGGGTALSGVVSSLASQGPVEFVRTAPGDILNVLALVAALVSLVPVTRTLGLAYGAFVVVNLVPPLVGGGLISIGRLISTLFPLFLWLGCRVPAAQRERWIVAFALGQALIAVLFYTWRPPV